jgi:hypothetical protein
MIDLTPQMASLLGSALGFGFSVAILSYLVGDNPLYRVALHIFIGVGVGYAALVTIHQVLMPRLVGPLTSGDTNVMLLALVPLALFIFLTFKLSPRLSDWGNLGIAFMLGVGTAVAIAGALRGTLIPQITATRLSLNPASVGGGLLDNLVLVIGTLASLLYFQFWVRAQPEQGTERWLPMRVVAGLGRAFIVLTLAATYAGMILSGISLFSERVVVLWDFIAQLIG